MSMIRSRQHNTTSGSPKKNVAGMNASTSQGRKSGEAKCSDEKHPVCYLKSLFALTTTGTKYDNQKFGPSRFERPRSEEIDAYDIELVQAVRSSDVAKLKSISESGKTLNACNRFGESIIHMACRRGDSKVVKYLVEEANVRMDCCDDYGRTPLHDACWTSHPNFDVLDILIRHCPPNLLLAEDVRGHTPFDYARSEHLHKWTAFLQERRQLLELRIALFQKITAYSSSETILYQSAI
jgi:ankyrin repeat protein